MKRIIKGAFVLLSLFVAQAIQAQGNVGIGELNPASKFTIKGNLSVGAGYSTNPAPANGAIIQGVLGLGTSSPNASAIIDISATDKGALLPRLSAANRLAISNPATGLIAYDTDSSGFFYYNGAAWVRLDGSSSSGVAASWLDGMAAPGAGQGKVGDYYLNKSNGDVYTKTATNTWTYSANIKGTSGSTGPSGPQGEGYGSTALQSITLGTGVLTITTEANQAYQADDIVRITANSSNFMEGTVISYSGTTLTVNITRVSGTGTFTNWKIALTGLPGATGPAGTSGTNGATGPTGPTGVAGTSGTNGVNGTTGPTGPTGVAGTNGSNGAAGAGYGGTSTSSVLIGAGAKTFTTQSGLAYLPNMRVRIANSSTNYVEGTVTSYSGTSLVINVDNISGSGTLASWNIGLAGDKGATGANGMSGATGATGPTGPTGVAGAGYGGTSTTSVLIGTGAKTFTTQSGLAYLPNMRVRIANSSTNYVEGTVTSYSGTSLVINADNTSGSGTLASWNIGLAGDKGATGANGTNGAVGATGPTGVAGTNGTNGATGATGPTGPSGANGILSSGTAIGNTTYWDGTQWVLNSNNIFNAGANVGIGTATPSQKLHVFGDAMIGTGTNTYFSAPTGSGALTLNGNTSGALLRMVMNDGSGTFNEYQNAYFDGTNHKYNSSAAATRFSSSAGAFSFSTALSGTAGNNITWKTPLSIQNNGVVNINTTDTATVNIGLGGGDINLGFGTSQVKVQPLAGTGIRPVYSDANGVLINASAPTTTTVSPATTITNNSCVAGATSNITLAEYPTSIDPSNITVSLNITHPSVADLRIYLISPTGAVLNLVNTGQTGTNLTNTAFSDGGAAAFPTGGTAPYTATFKPAGNTSTANCSNQGTISTFGALGTTYDPNGTWTLKVYDVSNTNTSNGTLNSWSINIASLYSGTVGTVNYARTTADVTNATGTLTAITGLSLPLDAGAVYEFEAVLTATSGSGSNSSNGVDFAVNYTGNGNNTISGFISGTVDYGAKGHVVFQRITALNTPTGPQAFLADGNITGGIFIKGIISTGNGGGGNLTIAHAIAGAAGANYFSKVNTGSYLKTTRVQ